MSGAPTAEKTTVINMRTADIHPIHGVRIDRSTPWGNPFHIDNGNTRAEVVHQFAAWVRLSDDPKAIWIRGHVHELRGKQLGCWCVPRQCHGYVLAEMADAS